MAQLSAEIFHFVSHIHSIEAVKIYMYELVSGHANEGTCILWLAFKKFTETTVEISEMSAEDVSEHEFRSVFAIFYPLEVPRKTSPACELCLAGMLLCSVENSVIFYPRDNGRSWKLRSPMSARSWPAPHSDLSNPYTTREVGALMMN